MRTVRTLLISSLLFTFASQAEEHSLRPPSATVQEWQSRKFGMFIHFGLYSSLGGVWKGKRYSGNYSEQIQSDAAIPESDYAALAGRFNPTKWDPDAIVRLAQAAGMQFIVLTAKHHDGFNLFGTKASSFNVVDASPYRKDIVQSLAEACKLAGMPFGVYYSTIDWHFGDVPSHRNDNPISAEHEQFNVAQLKELMTGYGPISEIWFDMGHPTKLQSKHFADTVHQYQRQCMVSGRVWNNEGDFLEMGDDDIPDYILDEPWESPASIYKETWGYRSWIERTNVAEKTREHIERLVAVVSRGGNYILNIGPRGDGSVVEYEAEILKGAGDWLRINHDAIYGTQPQPFRHLPFGYATVRDNRLYLFVKQIPKDGRLHLPGLETRIERAYLLRDAKQSPLSIEEGQGQDKSVSISAEGQPFLPVIVVECEGPPHVRQPFAEPASDGTLVLRQADGDRFYNANGEGYYDPPTLREERWRFTAKRSGRYRVEAQYRAGAFSRLIQIRVGDQQLRFPVYGQDPSPVSAGLVTLSAGKETELRISPGMPAERGTALGVDVPELSLIPDTSAAAGR